MFGYLDPWDNRKLRPELSAPTPKAASLPTLTQESDAQRHAEGAPKSVAAGAGCDVLETDSVFGSLDPYSMSTYSGHPLAQRPHIVGLLGVQDLN